MPTPTPAEILAQLQQPTSAHDAGGIAAQFADRAVLIGTSRYNAGSAQIRDYVQLVADQTETLRWDIGEYDVFLEVDGLLGFSGEGHVEFTDGNGDDERMPFRLTLVAEETSEGWRLSHFHGSVPSEG